MAGSRSRVEKGVTGRPLLSGTCRPADRNPASALPSTSARVRSPAASLCPAPLCTFTPSRWVRRGWDGRYYVPWDPQEAYYYSVNHGNFEANPERTEGTYSKCASAPTPRCNIVLRWSAQTCFFVFFCAAVFAGRQGRSKPPIAAKLKS